MCGVRKPHAQTSTHLIMPGPFSELKWHHNGGLPKNRPFGAKTCALGARFDEPALYDDNNNGRNTQMCNNASQLPHEHRVLQWSGDILLYTFLEHLPSGFDLLRLTCC